MSKRSKASRWVTGLCVLGLLAASCGAPVSAKGIGPEHALPIAKLKAPPTAALQAKDITWSRKAKVYAGAIESIRGWVTVLELHDVSKKPSKNTYVESRAQLQRQMKALAASGRPVVTARTLAAEIARENVPWGTVVIIFDDGYSGVYTYAYPVLRKYGLVATVAVIGVDAYVPSVGSGHLTFKEMKTLTKAGWNMASHTFDLHAPSPVFIKNAPAWLIQRDLSLEEKTLEKAGNPQPVVFVYPGGDVTKTNIKPVGKDYLLGFVGAPNKKFPDNPLAWPRVFVGAKTDLAKVLKAS